MSNEMEQALIECAMYFHQKEKQLYGLIEEMGKLPSSLKVRTSISILEMDVAEVKTFRKTIDNALGVENVVSMDIERDIRNVKRKSSHNITVKRKSDR